MFRGYSVVGGGDVGMFRAYPDVYRGYLNAHICSLNYTCCYKHIFGIRMGVNDPMTLGTKFYCNASSEYGPITVDGSRKRSWSIGIQSKLQVVA